MARYKKAPSERLIIDPLMNDSAHVEFFDTRYAETVPAQFPSD
jgi:hypothetical protein